MTNRVEMTPYQSYIHRSRYARWREDLGRRETYEETVQRLINFWVEQTPDISVEDMQKIHRMVLDMKIMPSMRTLMTAGPALKRNHIAAYNCSYVSVDDPAVFGEILYVLSHGTGVGFGVPEKDVIKLPEVPNLLVEKGKKYVIEDSKEGWKSSVDTLVDGLYSGFIVPMDYSAIRPAGAPLRTFGGRASGPEPLRNLHDFVVDIFRGALGRKLSPVECHDIVCKIAEIVVVGGVRRSALISLSDLGDDAMRDSKSGEWWVENSQRALANNSAIYYEKPSKDEFQKEWDALVASGSGERGIFSQSSAKAKCEEIDRDTAHDFGTNPCGEIILRSGQFCNLTEVVVRPEDTLETLTEKVKYATILGTMQSSLDQFHNLRDVWTKNTVQERLLGVSLTGICDNKLMNGSEGIDILESALAILRRVTRDTNNKYADMLGIERSAAITTVKPSGTVSQLVDSASGIHPRHDPYYIRRVRNDMKDPLSKVLIDSGIPHEVDAYTGSSYVFAFPIKVAEDALTRSSMKALEFLKLWATYKTHWTDHNPSVTVSVKEEEWEEVGNWVYSNWEIVGGLSFLPHSDHTYVQAPYETIPESLYSLVNTMMPKTIKWDLLEEYEKIDMSNGTQELACTAGQCSI